MPQRITKSSPPEDMGGLVDAGVCGCYSLKHRTVYKKLGVIQDVTRKWCLKAVLS